MLMGLWRYIIAQSVETKEVTEEIRALVSESPYRHYWTVSLGKVGGPGKSSTG